MQFGDTGMQKILSLFELDMFKLFCHMNVNNQFQSNLFCVLTETIVWNYYETFFLLVRE